MGIELDLRLSADGEIMVFHDETLARMTGRAGRFEDYQAAELAGMQLGHSGEQIPRLEDLLSFWPAGLPLLAELKIDGTTDPEAFATRLGRRLLDWEGLAGAMSFSPAAMRALPASLLRGQLIEWSDGPGLLEETGSEALAAGADYLGIHVRDMQRAAGLFLTPRGGLVVWTVRDAGVMQQAESLGIGVIFEYPGEPGFAVMEEDGARHDGA